MQLKSSLTHSKQAAWEMQVPYSNIRTLNEQRAASLQRVALFDTSLTPPGARGHIPANYGMDLW